MKIELMAPAKNYETFIEAINSGADSVYLGLKKFNARCMTDNFSLTELDKAVHYAHSRGKKLYLTLNTLVKDSEFDEAISNAISAIELGIDAIIVQDVGIFKSLLEFDVSLIASTQMAICNIRGVEVAKKLGFKRVVLARELNIDEISQIADKTSGIELECFIHGGLCIGYSGQCYMSTVFENAASNRGVCKTPCWNDYTLYRNEKAVSSGQLMKPNDMFGIEHIPRLYEKGISSLKIQGRTRSIDYVGNVVDIYRKHIDDLYEKSSAKLTYDELATLKAKSPRGLMRGNLETVANGEFVVKEICNEIPKEEYVEKYELGNCEKARYISVCFNDVSKINPNKLTGNIERIYIPFDSFNDENRKTILEFKKKAPIFMIMPNLIERYDIDISSLRAMVLEYQINGISLLSLGDLVYVDQIDCEFSTERAFNICNKSSVQFLKENGIKRISLPFELSVEELKELATDDDICFERTVYGRPPMVKMKYCFLSATNECIHCGKCKKEDDYILCGKYSFIVKTNDSRCETTLYPLNKISSPVFEGERNLIRLEFTNENMSQINEVISAFSNGHFPIGDYLCIKGSI